MEISDLKPKAPSTGSLHTQSPRDGLGTFGNFSVSFTDLLSRADRRVHSGINTIADRAGITAIGERAQPADRRDDDARRRRDDAGGRVDDRGGRDDHRVSSADRDDASSGQGADHRNDRAEAKGDNGNHYGQDKDRGRDGNGRDGTDTLPTNYDANSAGRDATAGETAAAGDDVASAGDPDGTEAAAQAAAQGGEAALPNGAALRQNAQIVLAGLVAAIDGNGLPVQAAPEATENAQAGSGGESRLAGLGNALAQVGQVNHQLGGPAGQGQSAQQGQGAQLGANAASQMQAQQNPEEVLAESDGAAGQAQALAELLGDGQNVEVGVAVIDQADILVSKPGASLVTGASLAIEGASTTQGTQTAWNGAGQNGLNGAPGQGAQHAAANPQPGATQTAAQQVQPAQAAAAAGGEAKGPAQTAGSVHGAQQPTPAGATEGQTPASNAAAEANEPQQTRESASSKPAHSPQAPALKHQVVEQVSVKIAKAVNAGGDKITIQLRPPELGRIEVKMEVAFDGRMQAALVADNKETLEMLRRDSADLAKSLQDAGLKLDVGDLSFSLRGGNEQQRQGGEEFAARGPFPDGAPGEDVLFAEAGPDSETVIVRRYGFRGRAGVDLEA